MRSGSMGTTRSREVDRVAAEVGFAIERGAGADIGGDIGDGDGDEVAAGIGGGIGVGFGVDGVVMVLGIEGIDGDERQRAPVLAALELGLLSLFGFGEDAGREAIGDIEGSGWRSSRPRLPDFGLPMTLMTRARNHQAAAQQSRRRRGRHHGRRRSRPGRCAFPCRSTGTRRAPSSSSRTMPISPRRGLSKYLHRLGGCRAALRHRRHRCGRGCDRRGI